MSVEKKALAAAIKERKAWETISRYIPDKEFSEQANVILRAIGDYYRRDGDSKSCDVEIIIREVKRALTSPKHRETFGNLISEIASIEVSPANVMHDLLAVKQEASGLRLATALVSGKPGNEIDPLLEEYTKWRTAESLDVEQERTIQRGTPLKEITKLYTPDNLIRVYPLSLNDRLDGGMLRGQHMVVFARPEMGKTLFLVNAVAGFLSQNLTVLYVGNEDPADDITLRIVCRLTKRNKFEVLDNVEDADIEARKRGYNNLIMAGLTPGSPGEIEELTREYKPDVVLIDQLRNLRMREDNYVRQLEKAATAIRTIGKRLGVFVVSVTQAGDSASGKAVLDMGDVDSSNTGIPAQADVMVGIGATQEDLEIGRRVLSLPKNKRSGRHEYFPVNIDTQTNRMFSVGATSE